MVAKRLSALIVLPVHNEWTEVKRVSSEIKKIAKKYPALSVLVVDDGSSDGTAEALRKALRGARHTRVMELSSNGGKGRAIRLAFARAKEDFLIFMDGDLAYSIDHLTSMLS